jgi:hypothetical protein
MICNQQRTRCVNLCGGILCRNYGILFDLVESGGRIPVGTTVGTVQHNLDLEGFPERPVDLYRLFVQ